MVKLVQTWDEQVYVQMTLLEPEMCDRHSLLAQEIG